MPNNNVIVHMSFSTLYEFEGWKFEYSKNKPFGPWPLKNNFEPRKKAGKKFYEMFERFNLPSIKDQEKLKI